MQVEPRADTPPTVSAEDFAAAMAGMAVAAGARVAVAVSGGADSMALAHLLAHWARGCAVTVCALTVDHWLRDEAADEARRVAAAMQSLGLGHATLVWEEGASHRLRPASAQAAAREARYRLMLEWCKAHHCTHLFLAHHADDQAETFLLRLARGSGVDGLAAMAPVVERAGVRLARPLLGIAKDHLVGYCRTHGIAWIEDPSNEDPAYGRVRLRAAREVLEREGLSTQRLVATARHMQRARDALEAAAALLLREACAWDHFGAARINLEPFLAAPEEIGLRALAAVLKAASGHVYRPRFERLARLYAGLRSGPWRDATLHGCVLTRDGGALIVTREAASITDEQRLRPGGKVVWDGRFELAATGPDRAFHVRRLEPATLEPSLRANIPVSVRETLPALFDSAGLAAVPHLNYIRADLTTCPSVSFAAAFICPLNDKMPEDDAEL